MSVAIFEWLYLGLLLLFFFFCLDLSFDADAPFLRAPALSAWTPVGQDADNISLYATDLWHFRAIHAAARSTVTLLTRNAVRATRAFSKTTVGKSPG